MTAYRHAPLLAAIALGLCGAAAEAPPPAQMPAATQNRLSVQTAPLAAATHAPTISGYARVIDAGPLALLDSDLSAALAAAAASQAEAARVTALHAEDQMVAARVSEAAVATARADQARLRLLRTRLGLEWGPALTAIGDGGRARLIQDLASGNAVLLRIDAAIPSANTGGVTLDLGPNGTARARILGPSRTADPRLQSAGQLAIVTGPQARLLGVGLALPVQIPAGDGVTGVVVPDSAVLRAEGQSWVYVKTGAGGFERQVLDQPVATPDGLFVASGVKAGDIVATRGASALYAAEQAGG
jgi:hypothetical protein